MRRSTLVVAFAAVLATLVAATAAFAARPNGKILFRYTGELTAKSASSVTITVENGNRPALRSLLGKSQEETFTTGAKTVFLRWSAGIPTKVGIDELAVGDTVAVNVGQIAARRSRRSQPSPPASSATTAQPGEAEQAAVSLPRHVRLGGGRQGDDRGQGRQPSRAEAADRAGHDADLHRRADGVPLLGEAHPDRRRCVEPDGRRPDRRPGSRRRRREARRPSRRPRQGASPTASRSRKRRSRTPRRNERT